jgi:hypothetical protein
MEINTAPPLKGTKTMKINRPITNPDAEAAKAARDSHFIDHESGRCVDCDCRPWGAAATWPCGTSAPREIVEVG